RAFMPISQIDMYRVENADAYLNQRLLCMIVEVVPSERNLVVSRRALLEREREEQKEKLWTEIAEGQVRDGIVRSVRDFGAFVELEPGVEGLVHVSELAPHRVWRVADVVKEGQEVTVKVLSVDTEKGRISLSLKAAIAKEEPKPDEETEEEEFQYKPPPPLRT